MTTTLTPAPRQEAAPGRSAGPGATPALSRALERLAPSERHHILGMAAQVLAVFVVTVVVQIAVISPLQYHRDQHVAFNDLRAALASGTAPVGQITSDDVPLASGTPLGTISIPAIGVSSAVFLSGTSAEVLQHGAGHRRDTVLPGQSGASVIMGRQAAFGGIFKKLAALTEGATITTVTGQGTSTYTVTGIRRGGDPLPAVLPSGAGRLTLVSATGIPYFPADVIRVDAELTTAPFPTGASIISAPLLEPQEQAFAGSTEGTAWVVILLSVWAAVFAGILWLSRWWGVGQTFIVGLPTFAVVTALLTQAVFACLPNLI
ncbi:sortase [Rarobacter incanus]|uniref:LPXTG-site transpeptidase (Sortase) family protein n=1 Tax=Rarobacter incanus TaxID=153494 RepID=A0A542SRG8_9MICO|nr:sortase [Rarobacter incanus]TQK77211.1 LPXTG-site transpeptidase (sortase) family protein [Rarobacter incanus]